MKWDALCELARELPEVTVGTWYATPGILVGKKGFVRLKEDGATVVFMLADLDEQEALLHGRPDVYFITDHYRGYPAILARLARLTVAEARVRLERAWRQKATPRIAKAFDAETAAVTRAPRRRASSSSRKTGRRTTPSRS